jgi:hypothetical protein
VGRLSVGVAGICAAVSASGGRGGDDDSAGGRVCPFGAAACETLYRNDRQMAMPAVMRVGTSSGCRPVVGAKWASGAMVGERAIRQLGVLGVQTSCP